MTTQSMPGLTVSCPLFFLKNERIDYDTLGRYLDDVCQNERISAVYSMAYNTRYRMLSDSELLEVNIFIIRTVKAYNKRVFVGHPYTFSRKSLMTYLENIANAKPNGISMLYPERYFGINDPIIEFLEMPARFELPVVLHEMKLISGHNGGLIDWPTTLLRDVFSQVNLIGIKEDSKEDKITDLVLQLCEEFGVECILAGGGKARALTFIDKGLMTWLNGSTMFAPDLIDTAYAGFIQDDETFQKKYLEKIERPFFENIVGPNGWHVAHRIALNYFGYGELEERFPHPKMPDKQREKAQSILSDIKNSIGSGLLSP